jgi:Ulp1 protease family, C-terminal catalytic domain
MLKLGEKYSVCIGKECISSEIKQKFKSIAKSMPSDFSSKIENALNEPDPTGTKQLELMQDDRSMELLGTETYLRELLNFKAHGPHGNGLFNNYVLNTAMKQLSILEPTFKSYNCTLIDFASNFNSGDSSPNELMHEDFIGKYLTYGCILNTLTSEGVAKREVGHWVALFIDTRTPIITVEYYNSTGNNAAKILFSWMEKLAEHIKNTTGRESKAINVSNVRSQSGPSECGIYSFHYVICRLLGIPYKQFRVDKINDANIQKLRAIFFNDQNKLGAKISKVLSSRAIL